MVTRTPPDPRTPRLTVALPAADATHHHAVAAIRSQAPAWAASMVLHVIVLLALALMVEEPPRVEKPRVIVSTVTPAPEEFEEFEVELPQEQPQPDVTAEIVVPDMAAAEAVEVVADAPDIAAADVSVELAEFGTETAVSSDLLASFDASGGPTGALAGVLGGRSNAATRSQLVRQGGGSDKSEAAVDAAVNWIINHQLPDGSWSFDHTRCASCAGACSHPGTVQDRSGATAMALLPLLGRGYTHAEGPYTRQIEAGLGFLALRAKQGRGKVYDAAGNLYCQGLAGIALSEAYALTRDERLAAPTQMVLNFIMAAQDPVGGGWQYQPKQAGDTSAVGWQLMALKSGHMANLVVAPLTVTRATYFLDSVSSDDGAEYGYLDATKPTPARSAVGLLCRMYLGWEDDHPALRRGVARLARTGPTTDLYYDYYATQVFHHLQGDMWVAWNRKMRDMLVTMQAKKGHEAGSWFDGVKQGHLTEKGGRLCCTSLATMILEVYYRHLPIYGQESVEQKFEK